MNIREYISSGVIETCVLGLASPAEREEFEQMCAAHAEVLAAREAFEIQLEGQLRRQGITVPKELKSAIFSRIGIEEGTPDPKVRHTRPGLINRIGFLRFVAAASLIVMLGSVMLNLYLLRQYNQSVSRFKLLVESQTQLASANQSLNTQLKFYEISIDQMKDPRMKIVKMPAVPTSPSASSMATVYWNTGSKAVWLLVNELPKPATGKQYQLWAIVDGKPVDAGTFDIREGLTFINLKTIPKAQAFAITLEKQGGSNEPTMNAMYVMGKVAG